MTEPFNNRELIAPGEHILRRISALTLSMGFGAAAMAFAMHREDWAKGLAGGAVLAWFNFRWLSRGIRLMVNSAVEKAPAQTYPQESARDDGQAKVEGGAAPSATKSAASQFLTTMAMLFRYALVGLGVYVIFNYLHVPLISIGLGLCAFVAAILAASVWEIVRPGQ